MRPQLCICLLASLSLIACDSGKKPTTPPKSTTPVVKKDTPKITPKTTPKPDKVIPVEEPATKPTFKKLSKDQRSALAQSRKTYKDALGKGRKLVQSKKYDDGIKSLLIALKANPSSTAALSELGWAYFKKGDLDRSRTYTLRGLRSETSPNKLAAMYYNLGRVEEAQKNPAQASLYYGQSLALRDNDTVQKRFDALAKNSTPVKNDQTLLAACHTVAKQEWLCGPKNKDEYAKCACKVVKQLTPKGNSVMLDAAILTIEGNIGDGGGSLDGPKYLAIKTKTGGWQMAVPLTDERTPGVSNLYHTGDIKNFAFVPQASGDQALVVRATQRNDDGNYGDNSTEYDVTKSIVVCKTQQDKPVCWKAPFYHGFGLDVMLDNEPGPKPTYSFWSTDYALTKDGKIVIKKKAGKLPKKIKPGTFSFDDLIKKQGKRIPLR